MKITVVFLVSAQAPSGIKIDLGESKLMKQDVSIFYKIEPNGLRNNLWISDDLGIFFSTLKKQPRSRMENYFIEVSSGILPRSCHINGYNVFQQVNVHSMFFIYRAYISPLSLFDVVMHANSSLMIHLSTPTTKIDFGTGKGTMSFQV